jgi:hypothetical protein
MKIFYFILLTAILFPACSANKNSTQVQVKDKSASAFKVIGYYYYVPSGPAAADLDLEGLTHINYN